MQFKPYLAPVALALVASLSTAPSSASPAAQAAPALPPVTAVQSLGLVQQNPVVTCRDGTYSALLKGKVVWTFNDTCMSRGGVAGDQFIDNTLSWDSSRDASGGITLEHDLTDRQGVPKRFVPYTPQEEQFNANHAPNELAIWPGHLVPDPKRNRALVFFGTVYRGTEIGFNGVGAGIAVVDLKTLQVTRPVQNPDPTVPDRTYMWTGSEQSYTGGYLVVGDMLYSYGGSADFLSTRVHVARVPLASVLDKAAWQYYDANGTWTDTPDNLATVYFGGAAGDTLYWSEALGLYVTVYQTYLNNTVYYRVARAPEGPWSEPGVMFEAEQGTDPSYAARVHTAYAEDGGRTQYITYVKNTGFFGQELPLTKVTLGTP